MTPAINAKEETVIFAFPKPGDWMDIVRDLKLTQTQERELHAHRRRSSEAADPFFFPA